MKRKYIVLIGLVCILLLAAIIYVINIGNSIKTGSPHVSETINESMNIKAFEAEYKIDSMSLFISDSLKKYDLAHINLSTLEYWIEKVWGVNYKYIFFEKINFSKKNRLLITDPTSLQIQDQVHPFIGFKIKNTSEYSGSNGMGGKVCLLNIDSIPSIIHLELYVTIDHSTEKYIGDITLKKNQ
jgi:hypothetical protein